MTSLRSRGGGGEDLTDPPAPKKSKPDISVIDKNPRERLLSLKNFKKAMIYLYETQDEDLVRKTMSVMPELKIVGPNTDQRLLDEAVSYCLEKSVRSHRIIFDACTISPETEKILSPGLRKCSDLRIQHCDLTLSYQEDLLYSAVTNQSLITLNVSKSALQYKRVKHLCEGLRHLDCVVQELRLEHCGLTPFCFEELSSVITTNQSLVTLDLSNNDPQESGVKHLCAGLRNPRCKLKALQLRCCDLTSSCEDLCSVIGTSRSLIKLDLSWNKLEDFGVKRLCDGLRYGSSVMQELRLEHCDLTTSCCKDLCSVMINLPSLKTLDLSRNKLQDSGVMSLNDGLSHPGCVLQELRLESCGLTSSCCEGLRYGVTNRFLIKLDLSWNKLEDSGVKRLCDGLRDRSCRLQELRLERCDLTSSCCEDLLSVISTNQSLITLDLSRNNLQNSEVKSLCEGLRDLDCVLQELWLWDCCQTPFDNERLGSIITNQSRTMLDLSYKRLEDRTFEHLCERLRHLNWALPNLRLQHCGLTSSSCEVLRSVISTNRSLIKLDLSWNKLEDLGVKHLCEGLRERSSVLQELRLQHCGLTSSSCEDLCSEIGTSRSLIKLDLSWNKLEDFGVKRLCDGLREWSCVLRELRLEHCDLTSSCCADLCSVMIRCQSLITLDLSLNKLWDSGVKCLSDGLQHPGCVLQELRLRHCGLTSSSCEDLCSVIATSRSLIKLDLSWNKLEDLGVKRLCEGLRHRHCILQELWLEHCDLTSSCCEDLYSVMMRLRSLITLDLSLNKLWDSGVKRLCDGLQHPDCVLKELRLESCGLTSSCCEGLYYGITNGFLIKLDLSRNKLEDSGVKRLCDGLRDRSCRLQELRLERCGLTSSCCEDLLFVISTYQSLITLDLSRNNLQDSGVKRLCEALRDPDCVLQELRLWDCDQTPFNEVDLLSSLITNRSLTTLDLSYKRLEDGILQRLCEGLDRPDCVLQELRLQHCGLTSSSCEVLRSLIATSRSLIILDLSWNKLEDFGVMVLCEGLRHRHCILQELRLEHCDLTTSCCADLRSVMMKLHSLITLDLSRNKLQDSGVRRLSDGLSHPGCVLQELRLEHCDLTSACCEDLRSVMMKLRSLITLDLSHNKLRDSGVMSLTDGLWRPGCVLRELRLESCGLTSSCCEGITNRFLINLDLSRNKLDDSGLERLCDGLRDRSCVLQEFWLERCGLTSFSCEGLRYGITNGFLIKLDLSRNKLDDSGVKRLCDGLRDRSCVLQELRLHRCNLTFSGIEYLLNTSNQSLKKLDI